MKSREYLQEVRTAAGLSRAVIQKIEISGNKITFFLLTDLTYRKEDVKHAQEVSEKYVPQGYTAAVKVMKSVPSAEAVRLAVADVLKQNFPALAAFVSPEDIAVEAGEGGGMFEIGTSAIDRMTDEALDLVCKKISMSFCGSWTGKFVAVRKDAGEIVVEDAPEEYEAAPRFFPIENFIPIDGAEPKPTHALYIADLNRIMTNVTVCGIVNHIEERATKTGKPFFSITLSDGSQQLRVPYFTRKATVHKVREIVSGDCICLTGDNEIFNGSLSFRAKKLDMGRPPKDFVPVARPSRPVPAAYKTVFPAPASDFVQADMFGGTPLPEDFCKTDFVVFDLETTGLNNSPQSGSMDRIIEVGAVKISGGTIVEKFSSFVACPVKLSDEIINLTGIDDGMLKGAPPIADVVADFYKFSYGCVLVGHNVQFDYKFMHYYGEEEGYLFDQRQYDTCGFAQSLLRLSNYKLNTVADYFGFTFNHHRAYDDAFVTAKIFIELVRRKGGLPN